MVETSDSKKKGFTVCGKCGAPVNLLDNKFGIPTCVYCGNFLNKSESKSTDRSTNDKVSDKDEVICIKCKRHNPLGSNFCNACGFDLRMSCLKCGHIIPENCGSRISDIKSE